MMTMEREDNRRDTHGLRSHLESLENYSTDTVSESGWKGRSAI